jgi:hypothetical protein
MPNKQTSSANELPVAHAALWGAQWPLPETLVAKGITITVPSNSGPHDASPDKR